MVFYWYFQVTQLVPGNLKPSGTNKDDTNSSQEGDVKIIDDKPFGRPECAVVVSDEDSFESELRKPPSRREIGEVKRVADQLRKISRPEQEIIIHPKPR